MKNNRLLTMIAIVLVAVVPALACAADNAFVPDRQLVERGRYVALVSGCNDCHTSGYVVSDGRVPESQWLTGDSFGWNGPWGTTYGTNLRLFVRDLGEDQWIEAARNLRRRPPMPWFNLNQMNEEDLRGLYHFIRSLGDPGAPAPAAIAPGQASPPPRAQWVLE